jgi:RNA polymerase sigma factor (sigma-70 family)
MGIAATFGQTILFFLVSSLQQFAPFPLCIPVTGELPDKTPPETHQLFAGVQQGDSAAARHLHQRYIARLLRLVQQRLSAKLNQRVDAEDIVQSAYRTFFAHAEQGDYVLQRSGDLWRLLAAIAINKVRGQADFHSAQRRSTDREEEKTHVTPDASPITPLASDEPTPDEQLAIVESVEFTLKQCSTAQRAAIQMRLQGMKIEEIAKSLDRSERTIRRLLSEVETMLKAQLQD